MNVYEDIIYKSRYARWIPELSRRETWPETVYRVVSFFRKQTNDNPEIDFEAIYNAILNKEVMPSMRVMMTAGPALERDNTCGYNCSYVAIDNRKCFDEIMFILLCGTGVGFSVERQYIQNLPEVPTELVQSNHVITVGDSKEGWARALRELIRSLYSGSIPTVDYSKIRPAGTPLKVFGGRASGPEPLRDLFKFVVSVFKSSVGRKLNSIECHDIVCKIGDVVVVGGVRRSALISLSNLTDDRMRRAKMGQWWEDFPHRRLANNSISFTEKPDVGIFMKEWLAIYDSKSGERGLFNRVAAQKKVATLPFRNPNYDFGTNPCSEIILRNKQFCNLSEVVIRPEDTAQSLFRKVQIATIIGTIQSTLTHFPYLSASWKHNTEEERLLGVSLTGIFDNPLMWENTKELKHLLTSLREEAALTNAYYADVLDIPKSTAITCVKPSGTVSQFVSCGSGIHPRWAKYYKRTIRGDKKDPVTKVLQDVGVLWEDDITNDSTVVFSFPQACSDGALTRKNLSAIDHLELWRTYNTFWCDHKPSVTIYVKEEEWPEVGTYVWKHFDEISGISFLPHSDHVYKQAPYQDVTIEEYEDLVNRTPTQIDWSLLEKYETHDETHGSHELACSANGCDVSSL